MIRKTRKMTVYKTTGAGYQHVPQIKMQGDWLLKAGFSIGDHIQIACQKNRLVISKNDPAQAD
ncbi:MAG: type I toxin-antitoxin system SymE family toxin [Lachnospiraceae bacterium]|nr:type I toxin-antitoxin system SymE family toxin [Lachnospiraceae bacterium]